MHSNRFDIYYPPYYYHTHNIVYSLFKVMMTLIDQKANSDAYRNEKRVVKRIMISSSNQSTTKATNILLKERNTCLFHIDLVFIEKKIDSR